MTIAELVRDMGDADLALALRWARLQLDLHDLIGVPLGAPTPEARFTPRALLTALLEELYRELPRRTIIDDGTTSRRRLLDEARRTEEWRQRRWDAWQAALDAEVEAHRAEQDVLAR